ncbi:MAG TPA: twin-arginine translocase TatA/TatE family subunit [Thermoanaerobaculia bacterium]|nr:twin-arginine translocase TatA/TatE family subunit [Thermoanaerobaculia bacterium]
MFGSLGFQELLLIFGVALLVFGPRKLPEIGRTVGRALGEFRRATHELKTTLEQEVRIEEENGPLGVVRTPPSPVPESSPTVSRGSSPTPAEPHEPAPPETEPAASASRE